MANEFRICDTCKSINMKTLLPKLRELDPEAEIKIGCQSYCGIGYKKPFVVVNNMYVTGPDEETVLKKVARFIKVPRP
ncbi:DUF1450 domain-containing protein [Rubeoparvulum massiliense]|uniref:DUF1450 domain-containing protein n=1 Tax=Rubeoparvulum massiliense TaxID=1631346 RepID=UPI00065E55A2|nr:DUF1450 domain-containing protein [Rubeoparvulum massiliense]